MRQLGIESAVVRLQRRGIIGLDMAIHHPERVTKLAVTGANARFDGYTADNQEPVRSFDPPEASLQRHTRIFLPTVQNTGPSFSDV